MARIKSVFSTLSHLPDYHLLSHVIGELRGHCSAKRLISRGFRVTRSSSTIARLSLLGCSIDPSGMYSKTSLISFSTRSFGASPIMPEVQRKNDIVAARSGRSWGGLSTRLADQVAKFWQNDLVHRQSYGCP